MASITLREFSDRLEAIGDPALARTAVQDAMWAAKRHARRLVSGAVLNRRSGNLYQSIRYRTVSTPGGATGYLMAGGKLAPYARAHEHGMIIKGNPWLTFKLPDGGWRKVEQVTIPRRPFLAPSIRYALRILERDVPLFLDDALTKGVQRWR